MKRLTALLCILTVTLTGCWGGSADPTPTPAATPATTPAVEGMEKTGLSATTSIAKSTAPQGDTLGLAQSDITLVAVTVDDDGVITSCAIDSVQVKLNFDGSGNLTTPLDSEFPSKNMLGADYGMAQASPIGREWNEQVATLANYAVGKTVDEIRGIAMDEDGAPTDTDLSAQVTISISNMISGIESAVKSATYMGAQSGDKLSLATYTTVDGSKNATDSESGTAQTQCTVTVLTKNADGVITGTYLDEIKVDVNFDHQGAITTDLATDYPTKRALGNTYGMADASSIDREWYQQAESLGDYMVGKTAQDIKNFMVDDNGKPTEADLTSSVTIDITHFQKAVERAGE